MESEERSLDSFGPVKLISPLLMRNVGRAKIMHNNTKEKKKRKNEAKTI